MSDTVISNFSHTAQQTQQCVNELVDDLQEWRARWLPRSVLHTLRDWLSIEEMADLSGNCILIRGIYFEYGAPPEIRRGEWVFGSMTRSLLKQGAITDCFRTDN
jgi:uncharacterized protein (DUF2267 family)